MAIIEASASPTFKSHLRKLYQDDGSKPDIALDMVDKTNQILLDNLVATGGGRIFVGAGAPTLDGVPTGSLYIRTDGASAAEVLYVNHDGAVGSWTAVS